MLSERLDHALARDVTTYSETILLRNADCFTFSVRFRV